MVFSRSSCLLWFRGKLELLTSLISIQKATLSSRELSWNPTSQSDLKYSILLKLDVWKIITKNPWFCSLPLWYLWMTKQSKKSWNKVARQKVTKLTSNFILHELLSTSRVELVDITKYILASLSSATSCSPSFFQVSAFHSCSRFKNIVSNVKRKICINYINVFFLNTKKWLFL